MEIGFHSAHHKQEHLSVLTAGSGATRCLLSLARVSLHVVPASQRNRVSGLCQVLAKVIQLPVFTASREAPLEISHPAGVPLQGGQGGATGVERFSTNPRRHRLRAEAVMRHSPLFHNLRNQTREFGLTGVLTARKGSETREHARNVWGATSRTSQVPCPRRRPGEFSCAV